VTKADGSTARVDTLEEGDEIVAATADGALTTDTVSLLSLAKPTAEATFLTLATAEGSSLTLTPEHHLPVGAACCSTLKKAKEVVVGDELWLAGRDGVATQTAVAKVTLALEMGLFSPVLTHGGFPVVDGVVTSFDSLRGVRVAATLAPYLEPLAKATGLADVARRLFFGRGLTYIDGFTTDSAAAPPKMELRSTPSATAGLHACAVSA
jgi:hypothetical protein